jgi:hypothetical protein
MISPAHQIASFKNNRYNMKEVLTHLSGLLLPLMLAVHAAEPTP